MSQRVEEKVGIQDDKGVEQPGVLRLTLFAAKDRMLRGLGLLGAGLAVGAVVIFIPILHFGLLLFLPGVFYFAYKRYQLVRSMESVGGACPRCKSEITIRLEADDKLPKWTYCPACNGSVQLVQASAAAPVV